MQLRVADTKHSAERHCTQRDKQAMGLSIPCVVQCPKQGIPILMWSEFFNEGSDFWRYVDQITIQSFMNAGSVVRKRKSGTTRLCSRAQSYGASINCVIKGRPQILQCVLGKGSGLARYLCNEPDLINILA